jgi:hypothetical protein
MQRNSLLLSPGQIIQAFDLHRPPGSDTIVPKSYANINYSISTSIDYHDIQFAVNKFLLPTGSFSFVFSIQLFCESLQGLIRLFTADVGEYDYRKILFNIDPDVREIHSV